jgi:hypothetical protein
MMTAKQIVALTVYLAGLMGLAFIAMAYIIGPIQ